MPFALELMLDEELVYLVDERRAEECSLQSDRHHGSGQGAKGPDEDEWFGREDGNDRRREAGEDVADTRAGGDHRKDALALEHVEVLADEGPEVEHHQLECDRVDDVGPERDRRVLANRIGGEDGYRRGRIRDQDDAERGADAEPPR